MDLWTTHYSLVYCKDESLELTAHCDADFANSDGSYSHSGYITYLNNTSSPISWSSRKQKLVARSSTESEYISLSEASCELLWLQSWLESLLNNSDIVFYPAKLYSDNQSAIALANTRKFTKQSKHINVKFNHVRDLKEKGIITLFHVGTDHNLADGLTKPLTNAKLQFLVNNSLYC